MYGEMEKLSKKCIIKIHNEVFCNVIGLMSDDIEYLMEKNSYFVEGYKHNPLYKLNKWDGRIKYFLHNGHTYTLLLPDIIPMLRQLGYEEIKIKDDRDPILEFPSFIEEDYFAFAKDKDGNPVFMRDYQVDAVNALLNSNTGLLIAATSAGKSFIICALCLQLVSVNIPTIIIVPNGSLVVQLKRDFEAFGIDHGEYTGKVKNLDHDIVISTWQALKNYPEVMSRFKGVIVDEAHTARGNVIQQLLVKYGTHLIFRYGVTGTLPPNKADEMAVKSALGQVVMTISAKYLQDRGFISTLNINMYEMKENIDTKAFPDYESETTYLKGNAERTLWIAEFVELLRSQPKDNNVFVLVSSKKMGRMLNELIEDSTYIDGDVKDMNYRDQIYQSFETTDNRVIIATFGVAAAGVSSNRINHMVLIDVGKSYIRVLQSIGRGLRKNKHKNHVEVHDIFSSLFFSNLHAIKRVSFYKSVHYPFKLKQVDYNK